MNNLRHYTRVLKHATLAATDLANENGIIEALVPQNTGSPLEDAKEALVDWALATLATGVFDTVSIATKVTDVLSPCTSEDISPCVNPTAPLVV